VATAQGHSFFHAMEGHFQGLERLTHAALAIRQHVVQRLTLACSPVLSTSLLPPSMVGISHRFPDLQVEIRTADLASIRHLLHHGMVDMALCLDFPLPPGVAGLPLGRVDGVCAMHEQHRLARKSHLALADLAGERIIEWLPVNPFSYSEEHDLLEKHGIPTIACVRTQTSQTRYALIAAGLGISIAEPFSASMWRPFGVVTRPLQPTVGFQYILACQSSLLANPFHQDIIQIVKKAYQALVLP
jgi:DNA-binding transcriptional LysR family regulator